MCGGCGEVRFCDRELQRIVWPFHEGYCDKEPVYISVEDRVALMPAKACPADLAALEEIDKQKQQQGRWL
jgi:hypothetical protein